MPNPIEELERRVRERFPACEIESTPAVSARGVSWFDVTLHEKKVAVHWSEAEGFGVAQLTGNTRFTDSENFDMKTREEAFTKILSYLVDEPVLPAEKN